MQRFILVIGLTFSAFATEPSKVFVGPEKKELSGLAWIDNTLVGVSDGSDDTFLYKITFKNHRYELKEWLDLRELKGYGALRLHYQRVKDQHGIDARLDLEGIATCGSLIFLADERARSVIVIDVKTRELSVRTLANPPPELWAGGENAGLEGIAVHCVDGKVTKLWLAKERDPKMVMLLTWPDFLVEGLVAQPQPESKISLDSADLLVHGNQLWSLERNARRLSRLGGPHLWEPIIDFSTFEERLYTTDKPFGQSEAIAIKNQQVYIGWDQNSSHLTEAAAKQYGAKGNRGIIAVFDLP